MELTLLQSIIFGFVQGVTEFLPISSSGHLALVEYLFGIKKPQVAFFVALHIGSLAAVIIYFWRDWLNLFGLKKDMDVYNKNPKLLLYVIIATIPAILAGWFFNDRVELLVFSPVIISLLIVSGSFILFLFDRISREYVSMDKVSVKSSIIVGFIQVFALIPGVSRSGMTISGARACGLGRTDAARFSFLIATPIIAGAGIMQFKYLLESGINTVMIVGVFVSFLSAFATIHYFLALIKKVSYAVFLYYSLGLFVLVGVIFYWL